MSFFVELMHQRLFLYSVT